VAEHTVTGTVEGAGGTAAGPVPGVPHPAGEVHHHGRPASWVAVAIICVGFLIGGIDMMVPPMSWSVFWLGVGISVVGIIVTMFARTLNEDWY
jgi:uncharacterized transporter YbjL